MTIIGLDGCSLKRGDLIEINGVFYKSLGILNEFSIFGEINLQPVNLKAEVISSTTIRVKADHSYRTDIDKIDIHYFSFRVVNMNSKKNRLILRLNKELDLNIPFDYPSVEGLRKYKKVGGLSWYFEGDDDRINSYCSRSAMTELLKKKDLKTQQYPYTICNSFVEIV